MKLPSVSRGVQVRLLAVAVAICTVSDGRDGRVVHAQTVVDPVVAAARMDINRGRYAEAESALKAVAVRTPNSDAALELGLLYQMLGRREEAQALLDPLANLPITPRMTPGDYARIGRAARALGQMHLANDAYQIAAGRAPNDAAIQTGWGELWLQTHDNGEAVKSFADAMEADENYLPAQLGMAQAIIDENPPGALKLVQRVITADPASVRAHVLLAQLELDRSDREAAKQAIEKAKSINPVSLDALALSGAIAYVEDRRSDFQSEVAAALKINPRFSDAYRVAADQAASNYRFEEAVALERQALTLDPDDVKTHAALGVHLLRTGDEEDGRDHLETAFKVDAFDRTTFNLLTMMDSLDKFEVIREGNLIIKLDPKEAPVMREFVGPLAQRALAEYEKKYQFTPKGPILIEMFPKHDDFAVRTVGLPGFLGALGACFGRVVTLDSPKARPPGEFNWEPTLWHELAHVITLQLSKQRVPRWLTEGISTYEEKLGSPDWGREGELTFAAAYGRGEHMSVRELNAAFTNPEKISLAYYEASLLTEQIVNTYGWPALRKLLVVYGEGKEGEAALKEGLGVDIDTLQAGFDTLLKAKYGPIVKAMTIPKEVEVGTPDIERVAEANPGSYPVQMKLADFLYKEGRIDEAMRVWERAAQLVPIAVGPASPHVMMAKISVQKGDSARAIKELEALLETSHTDLESARMLAKLLQEAGGTDKTRLMKVYALISSLDPFDAANHSALGRLKMAAGDPTTAAREFRAAIAAGSLDEAAAHVDLAESYVALGDKVKAKREAIAAMEVAPGYPRAQDLLLKLLP
ncbi:MAG TPA: tetratricopeptide repeat protein [Vicinamibacterales bacterium]|nr:tetratricopeptide repeat protein [Vicinamibacterales bacterium]